MKKTFAYAPLLLGESTALTLRVGVDKRFGDKRFDDSVSNLF